MSKELIQEHLYLPRICDMLKKIEATELAGIEAAAKAAYHSIRKGGLLHVFATGHSHMIAEEMFYRAGGLVPINPILDNSLMIHEGAIQSMYNERNPEKAKEVLDKANVKAEDTIIISSNSGINGALVEAAIYAKKKGLTVVGITSLQVSKTQVSRHESGKRLFEVCDIVIDNYAPFGDGLLSIPENGMATGGASTFSSLFIAQRIALKIENMYLAEGELPPIYMSANIPKGTEYNDTLIKMYQDKIKALR